MLRFVIVENNEKQISRFFLY